MLHPSDRTWNVFRVLDLFNYRRGNQSNMASLVPGQDLLISAKNINNGVKGFFSSQDKKKGKYSGHCITLNNDGDGGVGLAYYQPCSFLLDTHVYALYPKQNMSRHTMLYIAQALSKQRICFSHGYSISQSRLKTMRIMLPTDNHGAPDYDFMEQYIEEREQQLIQKYKLFIGEIAQAGGVIQPLDLVKWKEFWLEDICEICSGHDIYDAERIFGDIPYITSTSSNNGIKCFVGNNNETLEANCISVNRNGSVGYCFYHRYPALYSNDCRKIRLRKNKNKWVSLFLSLVIMKQKDKYNYSVKMGTARLKKQKILLPADEDGNPDYTYMEQYGKYIMARAYRRYFSYIVDCATMAN